MEQHYSHPRTDVTRSPLRNEDGVAMLTILMLTVILTVIGIAAISTTSQDLKEQPGSDIPPDLTERGVAYEAVGRPQPVHAEKSGGFGQGPGANPHPGE